MTQETTHIIDAGTQDLDQIIAIPGRVVVVDIWAPWCGPCKMIGPVVEAVAEAYTGRITVLKINSDEHPEMVERYAIQSIPTLLFFKDGELLDRSVGIIGRSALEARIDALLV